MQSPGKPTAGPWLPDQPGTPASTLTDESRASLVPWQRGWLKTWPLQPVEPNTCQVRAALDMDILLLTYVQSSGLVSILRGFLASVSASSISILTVGSDSMRNLFCNALIPFGKPI